ncbi:hypothetical protein [Natronosalvus vescus]|nr:hypothetical protein [Natronosalvus vescus]
MSAAPALSVAPTGSSSLTSEKTTTGIRGPTRSTTASSWSTPSTSLS